MLIVPFVCTLHCCSGSVELHGAMMVFCGSSSERQLPLLVLMIGRVDRTLFAFTNRAKQTLITIEIE
jgi:hypothetical protein